MNFSLPYTPQQYENLQAHLWWLGYMLSLQKYRTEEARRRFNLKQVKVSRL